MQLVALGRIAELSALLEVRLRQVLQQAMGIGDDAGEALFLGDRGSALINRIKAVGKFADMPPWFRNEAVEWAGRVKKSMEGRDDLIHRAPVILTREDDEDYREVGWNRSRRGHTPSPVDDDRLLGLIDELARLEAEAMGKLTWGEWEISVNDDKETKDERAADSATRTNP